MYGITKSLMHDEKNIYGGSSTQHFCYNIRLKMTVIESVMEKKEHVEWLHKNRNQEKNESKNLHVDKQSALFLA